MERIRLRESSARAVGLALIGAATCSAQSTELVSVSTSGALADLASCAGALSADGRFVAFCSAATNLASINNVHDSDVFVRDRLSGTTELVSAEIGAGSYATSCTDPALSADGRFVVFCSTSPSLIVGDTNNARDVFVCDREHATLRRVNVSSAGAEANGDSAWCTISPNGRYVAFMSTASNLVVGDVNGVFDVFLRDRVSATTECISVTGAGVPANYGSYAPWLSADGRFVAFLSYASNLVANDTNAAADVFVRDRQTGAIERVSIGAGGVQANADSSAPALSADGRWVAFASSASNLVAADTNAKWDVFVADRQSGTIVRASVDSVGAQADGDSQGAVLSADGRLVAFQSFATNLVASDSNGERDVFVRDLQLGVTERANVGAGGAQANETSFQPAFSADGRYIAFLSDASNLSTGDTNGTTDVFVRDRGPAQLVPYCTAATTTNGCTPSIASAGTPSASSGSGFTISVSMVEGQKQAILFYGLDNSGFAPLAWGAGSSWLCVKSPTQRTAAQSSGGILNACDGVLSIDWNTFIASNPNALGAPFAGGETVYAQAWFRDPPAPKTTNLSNALQFTVEP